MPSGACELEELPVSPATPLSRLTVARMIDPSVLTLNTHASSVGKLETPRLLYLFHVTTSAEGVRAPQGQKACFLSAIFLLVPWHMAGYTQQK